MAAPVVDRPSAEARIRAALWFAERGFGVFSVWSTAADGACRCPKGAACDNAGKHPIGRQGFLESTADPARIRLLLSAGSEPNYGLVAPDGVFILDVDGDGIAQLAELEAVHGPLPATLRTATAHGWHIFLRWPADLPRPVGQLWGFVTRWGSGSNAGYVIGPRSVHATGAVYEPAGGSFEIAELPDAWARAVIDPPKAASDAFITVDGGGYQLPEPGYAGSRYDAIRDYIASRYMRGMHRDEILAGVLDVLAPRFSEALTEPDIRARFDRAWKGTAERLGPPTLTQEPRRVTSEGIDAADLLALDLAPLRWLVPDLVPEGTTILAAPPKVGKSCLVYQIAVEASIGGELLGRRVTPGSVLYLALEDGKRRGQDRLRAALAGRTMPRGRLEVRWEANQIGKGLEDDVSRWLDHHGDAVMVAVDTLGKVRPRSTGKQGAYEVDVQDLARLQDIFRDRPVALVIVHHARKEASDDFLASVSGTYGVTGSADTVIVVRRKRLEKFGTIYVTGRDIADAEVSVEFDGLAWRAAPGAISEASFGQSEIYEVVRARGPIYAQAIADVVGKSRQSVQNMCARMVDTGAIARTGKGFVVATVVVRGLGGDQTSLIPPMSLVSPRDTPDTGGSHVRAREEVTTVDCHFYADHQTQHRRGANGFFCPICSPEDPA